MSIHTSVADSVTLTRQVWVKKVKTPLVLICIFRGNSYPRCAFLQACQTDERSK